jgi:hypothetical protein
MQDIQQERLVFTARFPLFNWILLLICMPFIFGCMFTSLYMLAIIPILMLLQGPLGYSVTIAQKTSQIAATLPLLLLIKPVFRIFQLFVIQRMVFDEKHLVLGRAFPIRVPYFAIHKIYLNPKGPILEADDILADDVYVSWGMYRLTAKMNDATDFATALFARCPMATLVDVDKNIHKHAHNILEHPNFEMEEYRKHKSEILKNIGKRKIIQVILGFLFVAILVPIVIFSIGSDISGLSGKEGFSTTLSTLMTLDLYFTLCVAYIFWSFYTFISSLDYFVKAHDVRLGKRHPDNV